MATRPVWQGSITFGLVSIPVKATTAVREHNVQFNQLNKNTGARINLKRVDSSTGEEVEYADIVKGYEISPDRYIVVTPEEIDGIAPTSSKTIDIDNFVPANSINPTAYDSTYNLSPDTVGEKAYSMLHKALTSTGKVAVGTTVMRQRSHPVVVRADGDSLKMTTLHWDDEVLAAPPTPDVSVSNAEVDMAVSIIEAMSSPIYDSSQYSDTFSTHIRELIEAKSKDAPLPVFEEERTVAPASDLLSALAESLERVKVAANS